MTLDKPLIPYRASGSPRFKIWETEWRQTGHLCGCGGEVVVSRKQDQEFICCLRCGGEFRREDLG